MTYHSRIFIALALFALAGCNVLPKLDDVLPDKRTEYKKSDSLPDLEVPPDLTSSTINDSMAIPNEPATLSQMQRLRAGDVAVAAAPDEQWVSVRQPRADLWPRLRAFFTDKGYPVEVDDGELGVLETGWGAAQSGATGMQRLKFRVFSEPGATPDITVLFISSQRQAQVPGADGTGDWQDRDADLAADKVVAGELNQLFNGAGAAAAATAASAAPSAAPAPARPAAEMKEAEEGRVMLALPDEYSVAWPRTDKALQRGGFFIEGRDEARGIFLISYFRPAEKKDKGWLAKMKFWGDDDDKGQSYQISLTGVGRKTELIVVNADGEWDSGEDARRILTILQSQYGIN